MKKYEQPLLFLIETSEQDILATSMKTQDSTDYDLGWLDEGK